MSLHDDKVHRPRRYDVTPASGVPRMTRRDFRKRRPDAAGNARPPAVRVSHGGSSRLLRTGRLDARSTAGRLYGELLDWWSSHLRTILGRDLTRLEVLDADDLARLELLRRLAWAEVGRAIQSGDHESRATAVAEYLRARRELALLRDRYADAGGDAPIDIGQELAACAGEAP